MIRDQSFVCVLVLTLPSMGCVEPARSFEAGVCVAADTEYCRTETSIRLGSNDLLVRAPELWRFHDEFGASLNPAPSCAPASAGNGAMSLKWRRALVPTRRPQFGTNHIDSIAVSRDRVAVNAGGTLWLLDSRTGIPTNIFVGVDTRPFRSEFDPQSLVVDSTFEPSQSIVAFAGDGGWLWSSGALMPRLLDLSAIDRYSGPLVAVSWEAELLREPSRPRDSELWIPSVGALGEDGTLFWRTASGAARALELSGRTRWEIAGEDGAPIVDGDRVYWPGFPAGVRQADGGNVWSPAAPWSGRPGVIPHARTAPLGSVIPVLWSSDGVLSAHRRDGSMAWVVDAGAVNINRTFAAAEDSSGMMFITRVEGPEQVSVIQARNVFASGDLKWSYSASGRDGGSLALDVPVPSRTGQGVYFVASDCQVYALDPTGTLRGTLPLNGLGTGASPRLVDGVLYVLTWLPMSPTLSPGERLWPDSDAHDIMSRYGCPSPTSLLCPPIEGDAESVLFLSAIQVEF